MTLLEKIKTIYSSLTDEDFTGRNATILLQNDSDSNGDYIAAWNHSTLTRPTDEQLA